MFNHFCWKSGTQKYCFFLDSGTWLQVSLLFFISLCLVLEKFNENMSFRYPVKNFLGCRLKNAVTKFKSLMHLEVRCHNKTILQPLKVSYYEDTWIFHLWDVGVLQDVELEGKSCSKKSWRILRLAIVRLWFVESWVIVQHMYF